MINLPRYTFHLSKIRLCLSHIPLFEILFYSFSTIAVYLFYNELLYTQSYIIHKLGFWLCFPTLIIIFKHHSSLIVILSIFNSIIENITYNYVLEIT